MDVTAILLVVIAAVVPLAVAFIVGKFVDLKAAAIASENKWDDALIDFVETVADRIAAAKLEDPETPLGE